MHCLAPFSDAAVLVNERGRYENCFQAVDSFPLIITPPFRTCIVLIVFFIGWWNPPGRDDAKLVPVSCSISTASCTFISVLETTCPFTMLCSESVGVDASAAVSKSGAYHLGLVPVFCCLLRPLPLQGENKHRSTTSRQRLVQGWSMCPSVPRLVSPCLTPSV